LLERIHVLLAPGETDAKGLLKRIKIISPAKRPVPTQFFEMVGEALLKRHRLHLRYLTRGRAAVSERDVSPQRLVHYRNTWYLDAWCHSRNQVLRFALDAIEEATTLDARAKEIPLKQIQAEMDSGFGIFAGEKRQWATLVFQEKAAQWVSREEWHPEQQGVWLEDGSYELKVPFVHETEIVMDILRHGNQVKAVAPASLVAEVARQLAEAAALY
jgi:predicted DNA-binding transcriptional regulator YafY